MRLENYIVREINRLPKKNLTGRRKIKVHASKIDESNIVQILEETLSVHAINAAEIDYLYRFYKGEQDIRFKKKFVRESINEKVTVNRANEIVTFKSAFFLSEPIQYVSHGGDERIFRLVNQLNEYMRDAGKESNDKSIVDWMHICGVAERLALRPEEDKEEENDAPFCIYSLDPRTAYVIYHDGIGEKPLAGVILGTDENGQRQADIYTKDAHWLVIGDKAKKLATPQYGGVPLVEYLNNEARMGVFETVLSILNNINLLESNAVDSIEDFVNGFDVFQNCDIEDGAYSQLSIGGKAVKIKTVVQGMEAKVYRVSSELSQSGVQERVDDLTDAYLEICGMPNRNGGSSTSDTGTAVLYRDGWSEAASRAAETEVMFRKAEKMFDRIVLNICRNQQIEVPKLSEFEPEFPRGNLANMQSKVQTLCEMLNNPKIHPKYAFTISGLFDDAEEAYRVSSEYYEDYLEDQEKKIDKELERERERVASNGGKANTGSVSSGGSDSIGNQAAGLEESGGNKE